MPRSDTVPSRRRPRSAAADGPTGRARLRGLAALLAILLIGVTELAAAFDAPPARPIAPAPAAASAVTADDGGAPDEDQAALFRQRPLRAGTARADLEPRHDPVATLSSATSVPRPAPAGAVVPIAAPTPIPRDPPPACCAPRGPPAA